MENLILALLVTYSAPNAIPAPALAKEIIKVSKLHKVDALTLTRIVLVESAGVSTAHNAKTHDYGLTQINIKTILALHITPGCVNSWKCNLDRGAYILSKLNRACRYNVGTGSLRGSRLKNCLHYERKLASL